MLNHPKLPFSPPFYTEEESLALRECIERRWTGTGPKTLEFEQKVCNYKSIEYSAAFSSCTSALFLALKSLGIGPGDEVITSAMTFCSTVNVIIHCGATPVLCDVDPISKNICPNLWRNCHPVQKHLSLFTMLVIPVIWILLWL